MDLTKLIQQTKLRIEQYKNEKENAELYERKQKEINNKILIHEIKQELTLKIKEEILKEFQETLKNEILKEFQQQLHEQIKEAKEAVEEKELEEKLREYEIRSEQIREEKLREYEIKSEIREEENQKQVRAQIKFDDESKEYFKDKEEEEFEIVSIKN
jgi:hypothetical protein